jgi:hypothetical protein
MKKYYLFIGLIIVVAAVAIGSNKYLSRGPVHDNQAVTDINTISTDINDYADPNGNSVLPPTLAAAQIPSTDVPSNRLADYTYHVVGQSTYKLCATFKTAVSTDPSGSTSTPGSPDTTIHPAGYYCFTFTTLQISPLPTQGLKN